MFVIIFDKGGSKKIGTAALPATKSKQLPDILKSADRIFYRDGMTSEEVPTYREADGIFDIQSQQWASEAE